MNPNRFSDEATTLTDWPPPLQAGFYLMAMAPGVAAPCSSLQCLYQQMYEQAVRASQPARMPDLFAVMN